MRDYIIIGAGQAGLAMAYYLRSLNKKYTILDANEEVGAPWLKRWDSLKLFTPSEFNNLPGMKFPFEKGHYADKYEVADYLKTYVSKFEIPVELNQKVISLKKENDLFYVKTSSDDFVARNVVVATGPFHTPFTPKCSAKINPSITQIHSEHYKNPKQLCAGDTLVVGAGDSGVQILDEVSKTDRKVYFSGTTDLGTLPQEFLGKTLWWWFSITGVLSASKKSWFGKKLMSSAQPIIGTDVKSLFKRHNIHCVGRTLDANNDEITFENGSIGTIKNIIWATGFKPNFNWIEGEKLDADGYPKNDRGVSSLKGLFYIGLPWLHTRGSATLGGVKRDARYLSEVIQSLEAKELSSTLVQSQA